MSRQGKVCRLVIRLNNRPGKEPNGINQRTIPRGGLRGRHRRVDLLDGVQSTFRLPPTGD